MRQILQSLAITAIVASATGTAIGLTMNVSVVKMIILCVVIQFIFFGIYNNYRRTRIRLQMEREITTRVKAQSLQTVEVPCANCGTLHEKIVILSEDNEFEFANCNTQNSVYINITTAQQTTPIRTDKLQIKSIIDNELDARARLQ